MKLLSITVIAYFFGGALLVWLTRDNPLVVIEAMLRSVPAMLSLISERAVWIIPILGAMYFLVDRSQIRARALSALLALVLCTAFFLTFTMVKTTLPYVLPFWADPMLARADLLLHLGTDPYVLTHALFGWINPELAQTIYVGLWLLPAMFFPVVLFLLDGDDQRRQRFLILYLFSWIGLGSVLALAFMSAGPIYYDALCDCERFAGLTAALSESGITDSSVGHTQSVLWQSYTAGGNVVGSGISAFPSVHLALATVWALYLAERWRVAIPVSILLVLTYLVLSVHTGWHYAIDSYASILIVGAGWIWLRRRR